MPCAQGDLVERGQLVGRKDEIRPRDGRVHPPGQALQGRAVLRAGADPDVGGVDTMVGSERGLDHGRPGRAHHVLWPQPELRRGRQGVGAGVVAGKGELPQAIAFRMGAGGYVDQQRRLLGPRRVPGEVAHQQQRSRVGDEPTEESGCLPGGSDGTDDQSSATEPHLPYGDGRDPVGIGLGQQSVEVEHQLAVADEPEGLDGEHATRTGVRLPEIGQRDPVAQGSGQGARIPPGHVRELGQHGCQRRVRGVVAEQERHHAIGHPECAPGERAVGFVETDEVARDQGAMEQVAVTVGRRERNSGQLQGHGDRRAAPGDVVVEVTEELLEARVHVRRQAGQQ